MKDDHADGGSTYYCLNGEGIREELRSYYRTPDASDMSDEIPPLNQADTVEAVRVAGGWLTVEVPGHGTRYLPLTCPIGSNIECFRSTSSPYDYKEEADVIRFLRDADMRLLRHSFLQELASSGQPLPREQEMQLAHSKDPKHITNVIPSTEWRTPNSSGYMESRPRSGDVIGVLSHPWWSYHHADPAGTKARAVCDYVRHKGPLTPTLWFIDWPCLPQRKYEQCNETGEYMVVAERTSEEQDKFDRALKGMNLLYGSKHTYVCRMNTRIPEEFHQKMYEQRGWCLFEERVSQFKGSRDLREAMTAPASTEGVMTSSRDCGLPLPPCEFAKLLEAAVFTNGSDRGAVLGLFTRIFEQVVRDLTVATNLDLTDDNAEEITVALPHLPNLKRLLFTSVKGRTGAHMLGEAFLNPVGHLPETVEIWNTSAYPDSSVLGEALSKAGYARSVDGTDWTFVRCSR